MGSSALLGVAAEYAEAGAGGPLPGRPTRRRHACAAAPCCYVRNGLRHRWQWLGLLFAVFGMVAAFGIGNTIQSNSVAERRGRQLPCLHLGHRAPPGRPRGAR
ncbi:MAG: alanine:cation symporter family protein [Gammaproteobacteria bacterium]|nr:alanine:cation symporter family protein [Gammaproteobacteria bacterium]